MFAIQLSISLVVYIFATMALTMTVTDAAITIQVYGAGDASRSFKIPSGLVGGRYFVALSRRNPSIRRPLACTVFNTEPDKAGNARNYSFGILGKTTVLDLFAYAREKQVKTEIAGAPAHRLKSRWRRNKRRRGKLVILPGVVSITSPEIRDITPVPLNVMTEKNANHGFDPVRVELTDEPLGGLTQSIASQYASGIVGTRAAARELKRARAAASDDSGDDEDTRDGGGDDSQKDDNDDEANEKDDSDDGCDDDTGDTFNHGEDYAAGIARSWGQVCGRCRS